MAKKRKRLGSNPTVIAMKAAYDKHFIPLESDPDVFKTLIRSLGTPPSFAFQDVVSLNEPDLLPRSALALILVFPTTDRYEERKAFEDAGRGEYTSGGEDEDIVWFKQTINNACGLYAILHALSNGEARNMLPPDSLIATLLKDYTSMPVGDRSTVLENSTQLESAYADAATQGTSSIPDSAEDEVDFHYVCFVKSHKSGRLYELDGDRKGPIDRGLVLKAEEDVLHPDCLAVIRQYINLEESNPNFSLMALVNETT